MSEENAKNNMVRQKNKQGSSLSNIKIVNWQTLGEKNEGRRETNNWMAWLHVVIETTYT